MGGEEDLRLAREGGQEPEGNANAVAAGNAPAAGVLGEIVAKEGDTVGVSALLGMISAGEGKAAAPAAKADTAKES